MLAALIRKETLALTRDLHALLALFLMPAAFIVIMSLALKNMYSPPVERLAYGFELREETPMAKRFVRDWERAHGPGQALAPDWSDSLRRGDLGYVLVLEPGMGAALASPGPAAAVAVRLLAEPGLEQGAFRTLQAEMASAVGELRATALQAQLMGLPAAGRQTIFPFIAAEQLGIPANKANAVQQNVPAWLVFGMFFVVTAISSLFVQEQGNGTLARLAGLGVPNRIQVLAKALPYLGVNGIQAALMLAVGVFLMPLLGGEALSLSGIHWPALALVLASISLAAIGFALLLACLTRTHAQASILGPMCNILMAALGGIMVPTFVMPPTMQSIAAYSPMNWGLEGLLTVLLRHGSLAEAVPWALRLALFGAAALFLAAQLFARRIKP